MCGSCCFRDDPRELQSSTCRWLRSLFDSFLSTLSFETFQVLVKPVVALVPEPLVATYPFGHLLQWRRRQPAVPPLRLVAPGDEACPLQNLQVLGDRRETHLKRLRQLRHPCFSEGQPGEDRSAGRVSKCCKGSVEKVRFCFSHALPLY